MRRIYILIVYLVLPLAFGVVLWRGLHDRDYWHNLKQRFGFGPRVGAGGSIWVHAVSVGEVQASVSLVRKLLAHHPQLPLVLTTVTPTGAQLARQLFGDSVEVRYVPYDLPGCVRRFFAASIRAWPSSWKRNSGPPCITSVGPTGHAAGAGQRAHLAPVRQTVSPPDLPVPRCALEWHRDCRADPERCAAFHLHRRQPRPVPTSPATSSSTSNCLPRSCRRAVNCGRVMPDRVRWWVAGSTHEGEEEIVLEAHRAMRERHPDALLLPAPAPPQPLRYGCRHAASTRHAVCFPQQWRTGNRACAGAAHRFAGRAR